MVKTGLRSAVGFLTTVGGAATLSPSAVPWFGPVGAVLGAAVGATWWLAAQVLPSGLAAGTALFVDGILTGLLHLDGLADSADGLLASVDRARRLEIMRQPDIGAFGVVVLILVVGMRWAALGSLHPQIGLVAGLWAGSRTLMAAALGIQGSARPAGLTAPFRSRSGAGFATAVGLPLALLLGATAGWRGVGAVIGGLAGGLAVLLFAERRLGGHTGDVLGAAGVVAEAVGLIVASVRG